MIDEAKLESIFATVLPLADEKRTEYLDDACGEDTELRQRVNALIRASVEAGSFFDKPPAAEFVPTIATGEFDTVDDGVGDISLDFLEPTDKPGCLGTLEQYHVIEVVGRGGMGVVLRAHDTKLDRVVAIKVMAPELAANQMAVKRFLREARAAAAVSHDHVVTIHAIDEENKPPFIVMEFVDGQSLQEKIDRDGALDLHEILRIGMQMARGLSAAHEQGLVHRDIKPANILLENGVERVKLTDFGLARAVDDVSVTRTGQIAGTPQFMSPEQAQGHAIDARSDLFSLGSVLYTMCTGRPPFRADTAVAMLRRVSDDRPRPIRDVNGDIPDWLEAITLKLLAKDPDERFQSAEEVSELFSQHLAHLQRPESAPRPVHVGFVASSASEILEKKLRTTARILYVAGLFSQMVGMFAIVFLFKRLLAEASPSPVEWVLIAGGLVSLPVSLVIEIGSGLAAERLSYRWVLAATALALLPINPFLIAMLPLTLWTLVWLRRPDVKELFASACRAARKPKPIGMPDSSFGVADRAGRPLKSSHVVTIVAMLVGLTVLAAVIYIQTDYGTVRVVVKDPDAKVVLHCDDGHRRIDIKDYDLTIGLRSGDNSLHIKHGDLEFETEKFSVKRGEKIVVRVERVDANLEVRAGDVVIGRQQLPSENAAHALPTAEITEVRRFTGHTRMVTSVAASPDGRFLLSGDLSGVVLLSNIETGKAEKALSGHASAVGNVIFSREGIPFSCSDDQTARRWNVETGTEARRYEGHTGWVWALAASPDGKRLVTGSKWYAHEHQGIPQDNTLRLWDVETGQEIHRFEGVLFPITDAAFSPDGRTIVAGGENSMLGVWDVETGKLVRRMAVPSNVLSVDFSSDGHHVASSHVGGRRDGKWFDPENSVVILWDVETGRQIHRLRGHTARINAVRFSPDGRYLASVGGGRIGASGWTEAYETTLRIWDVATGEELARTDVGASAQSVSFTPDGRHVVTGGGRPAKTGEADLRLWRLPESVWPDEPRMETQVEEINLTDSVPVEAPLPLTPHPSPSGRGDGDEGAPARTKTNGEEAAEAELEPEQMQAAVKAAQSWLKLLDAGKYADAWKLSTEYSRNLLPKDEMAKLSETARQPLGKVISREIASKTYTTSVPRAPDGQYMIIQFKTSFENKKDAAETAILMLEEDGAWRVSWYYIN